MASRFAATILLSICVNVLAHSLKSHPENATVMHSDVEKKPPMVEDQAVVRTHGSNHKQAAHAGVVESPVLRVQHHVDSVAVNGKGEAPIVESPVLRVHHHVDSVAVDGKGEAQAVKEPESEVPPVVLQDKPREPIITNPKAALNQLGMNESAPSPVVRTESRPKHATAAHDMPELSAVVGAASEAVQSRVRNRARRQSANSMVLEEVDDKRDELPETQGSVEEKHPTALSQVSGQWPPKGAAAETHVVLVFLALGVAGAVLAFAGVCGGFETKASHDPNESAGNDILAQVYERASPGVATAATEAPELTGAFMVPSYNKWDDL